MLENKKLPKALYKGKLPIGNLELDCYVLDNNMRILSSSSVFKAFDRPRKGMNSRLEIEGTKIPPFLASNNLAPLINQEVLDVTKQIEFTDDKEQKMGYNANILPILCSLYLEARRQKILLSKQLKFAEQAEILLTSFAKVGIVALIDEATGYQYDRRHDALRILLEKYIAEGLQKWVKTFPDEFFIQLDRIYEHEKTTSQKRPMYYGKFINQYIYEPIEKGYVKAELNKLNITDEGKRKARFHQWLSEFGKGQLTLQIGRVMGVMEMTPNIRQFREKIARQKDLAVWPDLFPETLDK